jgi:hypothetical protein
MRTRPPLLHPRTGRIAVAGTDDLEAQGTQHASGAAYTSAEFVWAEGTAEAVASEELILSQLVIFGCRLPDMAGLNQIPLGHQ